MERSAPSSPRPARRHRILVVDDDADMRAYLRACLTASYGEGVLVAEAADGREALAAARAEVPDLIITDLVMPRLDGRGLCRAVRAEALLRHVPVLLISGEKGADVLAEVAAREDEDDGREGFLPKPFNAHLLTEACDLLLRPSAS